MLYPKGNPYYRICLQAGNLLMSRSSNQKNIQRITENDYIMERNDEIIERYLRNEMNAYEEKLFKQTLIRLPILKERTKVLSVLIKGIRKNYPNKFKEK